MKTKFHRAAAILLALLLCVSCTACYSEDMTWAARMDDDVMPIGGYIYYLNSAYSEATELVPSSTEVLKGSIGGQPAEDWIRARALEHLGAYYYVSEKCKEAGIELTSADRENIAYATNTLWMYNSANFEAKGIAKSSLEKAYSQFTMLQQMLLTKMYSPGGELALTTAELEAYYAENYDYADYFYVPLTRTVDGATTSMTDNEQKDLKAALEDYVDEINAGKMTVSEAAEAYFAEAGETSSYVAPEPGKKANTTSAIAEVLNVLEDNEAGFGSSANGYYVIQKLPITDAFNAMYEDENKVTELLIEMNTAEFAEYVREEGKTLAGVELNPKVVGQLPLSTVVTEGTKYGTADLPDVLTELPDMLN